MANDRDILPRQHSPRDPQTGTAGTQSPEALKRHFRDVQWPATKQDIIEQARGTAAPGEVIRAIEQLPAVRFDSMEDVLVAYESQHASTREGHGRIE